MRKVLFIIMSYALCSAMCMAGNNPSISISFDAVSSDDISVTGQTTFEGSAPIEAVFHMEPNDAEDWTYDYEWRFCHENGNLDEPYMIRYEEEPSVTFTQAGTDSIALYVTFRRGTETVYQRREVKPLTIKATESKLTFPNAFSPNHDGDNDTYKPSEYKSIIEFKAVIYNRWGQKIYEWNDVRSEGWDGTFHGKDVKQGTYFVLVNARGADGRKFVIKKDVNLLRSFNQYDTITSE